MDHYHLNLSTKPFPAYRIVNVLLFAIFVILLAVSAGQAYGFKYYSDKADKIRDEARNLTIDVERLTKEEERLTAKLSGATAKIGEINYINGLIDRRNFCWTCLLHHLEIRIPYDVHLTSLKPEVNSDGTITLSIKAQGKTLADLAKFVDQLQKSEVFEKVDVAVEQRQKEKEFNMVMTVPYFPHRDKNAPEKGILPAVTPSAPKERRGE